MTIDLSRFVRRCLIFVLSAASAVAAAAPAARPSIDWSDDANVEVSGRSGAVVAGPGGAATVGIAALVCGGNAFDAAAATLLAETVTEPTKFAFGGEMAVIVYDAARGKVEVLNGQGKAPALATLDYFRSIGGIPGPGKNLSLANDNRNATVPAALSAICTLLDRYGTFTFEEAAVPTLRMLEGDSASWRGDLAGTLRVLIDADVEARAAGGSRSDGIKAALKAFYGSDGRIARRLVAWSEANGALLRAEDLASHATPVEEPVRVDYRGLAVYKCGSWTQGPFMLETLQILEGFDVRALGHNTPAYIHLVTEAMKLGLADRDAWMCDPAFMACPLAALLSDDYAALRRGLIDLEHASLEIRPGDPVRMAALLAPDAMPPGPDKPKSDTTTCITADAAGNVVVATPSGWGGALAGDTGVWLNSRLSSLNTWPGHPNCLEPGKRPRITLTPTLVLDAEGRPVMAISIAGGDAQDQLALNLFLAAAEFGMSPGPASTCPHFGTSHLTGSFNQPAPKLGSLEVQKPVGQETIDALKALGHDVQVIDGPYWTPSMMTFDPATGVIRGAGDPAAQRCSAAY